MAWRRRGPRRGAWHGGGRGWNGGGGGGWWGPALAAGALLAAPYYGYGYGGSCTAYSPMYDAYGNYIGEQLVNVC